MKTSKRLLSLLLALTMVLSLMGNLSVAAFADDEPQSPEVSVSETEKTPPADPENSNPEGDPNANPENSNPDGDPDANPNANPENGNPEGDKNDVKNEEAPVANEEEPPVAAVPTRKADYPAESSDTVKTGTAYLLSDLQAGKIFAAAEGQTLTYENYYYERSEDGGVTWSAKTKFDKALFGATLIQITETKAGVYTYRFYASHDGENFSADTWTLTLTVEDNPTMNFTFYVSQDYTGKYPVIKLYNVTTDDEGNEALGDEIENAFLYSNFTDTLPEGEESYDPASGKLDNNYQMFYAKLTAGRYAYRAFTADGTALGGMTLDLPTNKNVDGGTGGGDEIYLQCNSFYTNSKKTDNTYFTAEEYHVRVTCPIMKCDAAMGDPYVKGNYTYYPTMLYAAGNACLYNTYAYPDIDGYIFTQNINQTFRASYSAGTKSLTINTGIELTVTVPADATFGLYFQWNNFNTTEVDPLCDNEEASYADRWTVNGDTKTATYFISKGNSNYTWRLSDDKHVTQAGWLAGQSKSTEMTFSFAENAATDRVSHDFSNLGTQTSKRDEADLQINLDPSGYEAISGTTRVRAYRHWQLINNDAGNIMVEPDFHWSKLSGNAAIATVNGGNAGANWADITPGTKDSIIAVYYDSVDVNHGNYGSHGGLFPATNPERVALMVVGGTRVTHGTADAKIPYNSAPGATSSRPDDWDYNYDTWFYEASEKDPSLDFTVTSTGKVTVKYALAATDDSMNTTVSKFQSVSADADGNYTVPLAAFNTTGNGKGGTVIIKMTDSTGVSYRLVRVAKVAINAENVSNPGEDIMPGDQVKLTFDGMYRAVNKISGIFNPTTFNLTYYAGDTKYEEKLAQYQRMDNAAVTVTIPTDVAFADGASTADYSITNGYTYGSMYAKSSPFTYLYEITDAGVGTNFNAVTVNFYLGHYADAVVTVHKKVAYDVKLNITDENGKTVEGVTITLLDRDGNEVAANEDGTYTLGYGPYTYTMTKNGFVTTRGSFSLGSADAAKEQNGVLPVAAAMTTADDNAWDGKTTAEPEKDANGVYQIGTAAELAWFAAKGSNANAKLTEDIELTGYDWTPMKNFYGTFDGNGKTVKNLYINSASYPLGLFGYLKTGAKVTNLGVTGNVTCTAKSSAQAGGIAGYVEANAAIENCYSAVNVTSAKHGGGIAGYTYVGSTITNCYASGDIATSSTNECYLGGIAATNFGKTNGATLTDCYSIGNVTGSGGKASYLGGLSPSENAANYVGNCFYLENTVTGESPTYNITGKGTAKTVADMRAAIEANKDHPFKKAMLADLDVVEQELADKAAAKAVDDLIDAIGEVALTDDSKAKIDAARKAYNALTDEQKALVSNLATLTDAETAYQKLADDKAAADDVIEKINNIGKVKGNKDSKDKIADARAAYDALTDEQKALVVNYETLTKAERRYKQLKNNGGSGSSAADSATDGKTDGKTDSKTDGKNVKSGNTGDDSHLTLWLGGAVLSAAALALLAKKRRQDA